jgi:hypothetical protein
MSYTRYKVVEGSQSCHCCFAHTVVDTTKPSMIGDTQYVVQGEPQWEAVCECFEEAEAKLVCEALNVSDMLRKDRENR